MRQRLGCCLQLRLRRIAMPVPMPVLMLMPVLMRHPFMVKPGMRGPLSTAHPMTQPAMRQGMGSQAQGQQGEQEAARHAKQFSPGGFTILLSLRKPCPCL